MTAFAIQQGYKESVIYLYEFIQLHTDAFT